MTTLPTALLHQVCEHPASDDARLICADWLEENGDHERAELIRVQCDIAAAEKWYQGKIPPTVEESTLGPLRRRERELLNGVLGLGAEALPAVPGLVRSNLGGIYGWYRTVGPDPRTPIEAALRRGFVESVTCTAADWLAIADRIAWHPGYSQHTFPETACPLTEVRLTGDLISISTQFGSPLPGTECARRCWIRAGDREIGPYTVLHLANPPVARQRIVMTCLAAEWPWLKFLPPETA
jgi:uncharacterized protein (TIGR02996 family)